MKKISGIYCIENTIDGKKYIGSAVNIKGRRSTHLNQLRNNKHHSIVLQRAWNKYGEDAFVFTVLANCPREYLLKLEQWFINNLNPEYNILKIAGSTLGYNHSDESKKKISIAHKGRIMSEEFRFNVSKGLTGRKLSDEHKKKLTERVHSEETRKKISTSKKGIKLSEEWRENIRKSLIGHKRNVGTIQSREHKINVVKGRGDNCYINATFKITKPDGKELFIKDYDNLVKYFNCSKGSPYDVLLGRCKTLYKHKIEVYNG